MRKVFSRIVEILEERIDAQADRQTVESLNTWLRERRSRIMAETRRSIFFDSEVERDLEQSCCNLQAIVEGHVRGQRRKKLWGEWRARLQQAYDLTQGVLDEIRGDFDQNDRDRNSID